MKNATQEYRLPGAMVRRLMRRHRVTIKAIAERFNITQKRVREVRSNGVVGFLAREWTYMITGEWPPEPNRGNRQC